MKKIFSFEKTSSSKEEVKSTLFKVKNFKFTQDPIPNEYKFEKMEEFVKEIPLYGYPNAVYIRDTLVPEFEDAYNKLTPVINDIKEIIEETHRIIKKGSKPPRKYNIKGGIHYFNEDPYHKLIVIRPVFIQLRTSLNAIRLSILNERLSSLTALQRLCKHLAENPRYYHINIERATQSWQALEFFYIPDVFSKYIAFRNKLDDIMCLLNFIPSPFGSDEANKNLFIRLINCHLKMRDPITGYIPYVDEFETLALFLDSKASPFNLRRIKSLDSHQFQSTLTKMHETLIKWSNISAKQRNLNEVVKSVVARMLFDKYRLDLRPIGLASASLQNHINLLAKQPLAKIGVTKEQVPEEFLNKMPSDLFNELPDVKMVPDSLMQCLFCTNPVDAAYLIYKAGLALSVMIANVHNEQLEKSQRFDDLFSAWRIAIVAAEIPEPDQLFHWISMYKNIEVMPPVLAESFRIPKTVVKTMLRESLMQAIDM